jgi:ABC-type Na+ efflux pump permease subunit
MRRQEGDMDADTGLFGLAVLLLGAALFGTIQKGGKQLLPLGDRIASGMLAVPLLALMVYRATDNPLSLLLPLPLAAYLTALAYEDGKPPKEPDKPPVKRTWSLVSIVTCLAGLFTYATLAAALLR